LRLALEQSIALDNEKSFSFEFCITFIAIFEIAAQILDVVINFIICIESDSLLANEKPRSEILDTASTEFTATSTFSDLEQISPLLVLQTKLKTSLPEVQPILTLKYHTAALNITFTVYSFWFWYLVRRVLLKAISKF